MLTSCSGSGSKTQAVLTGRVVYPDDANYPAAKQLWDGLFITFPLAIVFAQQAQDVINAITWCRQNNVEFRARSGRHSLEGWSSLNGGIVIDVSEMKNIVINRSAMTATLQTGYNQGEIVAALGQQNLTLPLGSEGDVGVAGVTLGGGFGYLTRQFGVTCDNLLAVDIVVPSSSGSAKLIHADANNHADLLWACRGGGGGNFGIATAFTFRLHEINNVIHFKLDWDFASVPAVINAWQSWFPFVDARLGSTLVVLPKSVEVEGYFNGPEVELRHLLAPLLAINSPNQLIEQVNYAEKYAKNNAGPRQLNNWKFSSSWVYQPLSAHAIAIIMQYMSSDIAAQIPGANYWCLGWGGATRKVPSGGAAFYHRNPLYYAEPGAGWNDNSKTPEFLIWVENFSVAMRPFVEGGYVNVPDASFVNWGELYYGINYARLREIKSMYDPENIFNFPQSIPLA
jgi:FAD/FMN-containing dehydrogenase